IRDFHVTGVQTCALPISGWEAACQFVHFGCISLVRQPLGERLVALAVRLADAGVPVSFDPNCRNLMGADYPPLFERLAARAAVRSEERRGGKGCRCRWGA